MTASESGEGCVRGVYDIYWGDYRMHMLSPQERWALQRGQITPREARGLYELACFLAPRILTVKRLKETE